MSLISAGSLKSPVAFSTRSIPESKMSTLIWLVILILFFIILRKIKWKMHWGCFFLIDYLGQPLIMLGILLTLLHPIGLAGEVGAGLVILFFIWCGNMEKHYPQIGSSGFSPSKELIDAEMAGRHLPIGGVSAIGHQVINCKGWEIQILTTVCSRFPIFCLHLPDQKEEKFPINKFMEMIGKLNKSFPTYFRTFLLTPIYAGASLNSRFGGSEALVAILLQAWAWIYFRHKCVLTTRILECIGLVMLRVNFLFWQGEKIAHENRLNRFR